MQGRNTELNQALQEERRERRLFQEETIHALKGHLPGDGSLLFTPVSEGNSSWHSDGRNEAAPASASKGPGASSGEFENLDQNQDGVLDRDEFARLNQVFNK